jgi:hypothetical protein
VTVITIVWPLPRFPDPSERHELARQAVAALLEQWREQVGRVPDDFSVLLARPGEIGPSRIHRTHRADEGAALTDGTDAVPVAFHLSDDEVPESLYPYVALRGRGKS